MLLDAYYCYDTCNTSLHIHVLWMYRSPVAAVVCSNCSPATKSKWHTIGRNLGQSEEHLATIASSANGDNDRLWKVLEDWEEGIAVRDPDNYNDLVAVLVKAGEHRLASALKVVIQKQRTARG